MKLNNDDRIKARKSIAKLNNINSKDWELIKIYVLELEMRNMALNDIHKMLIDVESEKSNIVEGVTKIVSVVNRVNG